ncbi:P21-like protein, partial [Tanacetum coccineum]
MATLHSHRYIPHFTSLQTTSYKTPSLPNLHFRRRTMASAADTDTGNSEATPDVLVQYVVLRRDLIDTWPLGSVVTQGCHASVAAIWSHKDDPHTVEYCSPLNIDSMHKVTLEVKGETQLKNLSEKLTSNNIAHKLWIEQPENYPTCLASKPYPKSIVSTFFKKLKLSDAAMFDIRNNCPYTVWAGAVPGGGQQLNPGQTWSLYVAPGTSQARIWPRTNCNFDGSGRGWCQTGDCNGLLQCQNYGTPPNSLAEYALNQFMNLDFFDISLIDGFNVPMEFSPNSGGCTRGVVCTADINGQCPNELRASGGCNNPCTVNITTKDLNDVITLADRAPIPSFNRKFFDLVPA